VDELVITGKAMTTAQVRAIFESNAPSFVETSTWAWQTPNNLAWADSEGLWCINSTGVAAFGVSGVDGKSWGNLGGTLLDKGDVLIGNGTQYILWDASTAKLRIYGELVVGGGANYLWLNDANDGGLAIGGTVKGSAPFRVSAAGVTTLTNANLNLNGSGSLVAGYTTVNANGISIGSWPGSYAPSATLSFTYGGVFETQALVAGSGVTTVTIDGRPTGSGSSINNTVKLRGRDRTEWGSGYSELEVDGSGTTIYGKLFIDYNGGANTTRYFYDDGTYTRYSAGLVVDGDIYWGAGAQWLSYFLNQPLLTTSSPTFNNLTASGYSRALGGIGTNQFNAVCSGGLYIVMTSGEPGVSYTNGFVGYNYGATGGSTMGQITGGYGGGFIKFHDSGLFKIGVMTSAGTVTTPFILGANNLGLGAAQNTAVRLYVHGIDSSASNYAFIADNSGLANLMYLRNDGYSWVNHNWAVGSDAKLKDNIRDTDRGLADILKAKPRKYERKINGKTEHGFVAQELVAVFPELVSNAAMSIDEDGGMGETILAVDYTSLIPVLVKAVQELSAEVAALKRK